VALGRVRDEQAGVDGVRYNADPLGLDFGPQYRVLFAGIAKEPI
jgi:hypothetical protein